MYPCTPILQLLNFLYNLKIDELPPYSKTRKHIYVLDNIVIS